MDYSLYHCTGSEALLMLIFLLCCTFHSPPSASAGLSTCLWGSEPWSLCPSLAFVALDHLQSKLGN